MAVVFGLTFLYMPWQVVFVGCWVAQLLNCNATSRAKPYPGSVPTLASTPTELTPVPGEGEEPFEKEDSPTEHSSRSSQVLKPTFVNVHNQNKHILLLMTWLLPHVAPLLAAWVRTVQTAGYMTPFNGSYSNVLYVLPWLVLVNVLGRGRPINTTYVSVF
ncbi:hypothetical protein JVU11DRAFT_2010 [Chiua virens]|nr:hypothetical protein JVU11DRAFT_2010 [Chiua virens]